MYADVMDKYGFIPANHVAPIEFEVLLNGIYDRQGRKIPGHKAVVRSDTGDTLAVHSDKYSLVPYQVHFDAFEKAIAKSGLNTTNLRIGTDLTNNGARIFRQYLFPDHMVEVDLGRHGMRPVAMRIVMFDSYDGSSKFRGMTGAFDFVCANQSVSGKEIDSIGFKHVGEMADKIDAAAEQLSRLRPALHRGDRASQGVAPDRPQERRVQRACGRHAAVQQDTGRLSHRRVRPLRRQEPVGRL